MVHRVILYLFAGLLVLTGNFVYEIQALDTDGLSLLQLKPL